MTPVGSRVRARQVRDGEHPGAEQAAPVERADAVVGVRLDRESKQTPWREHAGRRGSNRGEIVEIDENIGGNDDDREHQSVADALLPREARAVLVRAGALVPGQPAAVPPPAWWVW